MKVNSMITAALILVIAPCLNGCIKPAAELGARPAGSPSTAMVNTTPSDSTPSSTKPVDTKAVTQDTLSGGATGSTAGDTEAAVNEDEGKRKFANNPKRLYQLGELEANKVTIGKHTFDTWVMDDNLKRQEGMMWLENKDFLDTDSMTFVYNEPFVMGFWMRNTLVDLDIAFIDKRFNIVRVTTMKKLDEHNVSSNKPAMIAIEFRAGLLKKKGITEGMKVTFKNKVASQD